MGAGAPEPGVNRTILPLGSTKTNHTAKGETRLEQPGHESTRDACLAIIRSSSVASTSTRHALLRFAHASLPTLVAPGVDRDAQVREPRANTFSHASRPLADAPGEHDRVEPAERRREGPDGLARDMAEHLDRQGGARGRFALASRSNFISPVVPDTPSSPERSFTSASISRTPYPVSGP